MPCGRIWTAGNEESEEYDDWADAHEELEDRIDEVLDRLDELN